MKPLLKPIQMKHKRRVGKHTRRNRTRSLRQMKLDLDDLARQEVFERDQFNCIFRGMFNRPCGGPLQWCHVLSRRHLALRWMEENAFCGCASHHMLWHHEPALVVPRFYRMYPERERLLEQVSQTAGKVNVRELWLSRCGERKPLS